MDSTPLGFPSEPPEPGTPLSSNHKSAVDLFDEPFGRGCVAFLNDSGNLAVAADDPPVPVGAVDERGEHRRGRTGFTMCPGDSVQRVCAKQGNITGQQHDRSGDSFQDWGGLQQRMCGPELGFLDDALRSTTNAPLSQIRPNDQLRRLSFAAIARARRRSRTRASVGRQPGAAPWEGRTSSAYPSLPRE